MSAETVDFIAKLKAAREAKEEASENGLARAFIDRHESTLRHSPELGKSFLLAAGRWDRDIVLTAFDLSRNLYEEKE